MMSTTARRLDPQSKYIADTRRRPSGLASAYESDHSLPALNTPKARVVLQWPAPKGSGDAGIDLDAIERRWPFCIGQASEQ